MALLGGFPLLAHAVRAASTASHITRVVVSTDDPEIAQIAQRYGAEVVLRPESLSGDHASSESAVLHVLETLEADAGYVPELVMMIQCTSPLTCAADLDGLVETLERETADSAFTAARFHHFLWQRAEDGAARGVNHEGKKRKRRQDLTPEFLETGAAYVMRTARFRADGERFCGRTVMHETPAERCLEIDDPLDFAKAEALLRALDQKTLIERLPRPVSALVMDFDGVLTNNRVVVDQDGREAVLADRGDGMGLGLVRARGIPLLILSKEPNPVVSARARKLKIECLQGIDDKPTALVKWLADNAIDVTRALYVGNDINDLGCMQLVGCSLAPADAHPEALAAAHIILKGAGGQGAVRELCDAIVAGQ